MSALDDIFLGFDEVFEACQEQTISRARAQLAQLRARVDMLDILEGDDGLAAANRLMDACERGDIPQQILPDVQMARNGIVALRAEITEINSTVADIAKKLGIERALVEQQERKLEEARKLIKCVIPSVEPYMVTQLRAWLSAQTAPRHFDMCPCVAAEHPVKPCSNECWHFTPDVGHQCVNCGQPSAPKPDKAQ